MVRPKSRVYFTAQTGWLTMAIGESFDFYCTDSNWNILVRLFTHRRRDGAKENWIFFHQTDLFVEWENYMDFFFGRLFAFLESNLRIQTEFEIFVRIPWPPEQKSFDFVNRLQKLGNLNNRLLVDNIRRFFLFYNSHKHWSNQQKLDETMLTVPCFGLSPEYFRSVCESRCDFMCVCVWVSVCKRVLTGSSRYL